MHKPKKGDISHKGHSAACMSLDSLSEMLCSLKLLWAIDTAAYYAAVSCLHQQTVGPAHTDIPLPSQPHLVIF